MDGRMALRSVCPDWWKGLIPWHSICCVLEDGRDWIGEEGWMEGRGWFGTAASPSVILGQTGRLGGTPRVSLNIFWLD
jgi:hypothetical protein